MEKLQISLAAARVNAGKTQQETAAFMRVSKQTVVFWEKGRTEPKASQALALADFYNIPLDNIFLPKKSNGIESAATENE